MTSSNETLRSTRDHLFDRLEAILREDERVRAVWLSGSFGRSTEDDWSDIDVHLAVDDAQVDAWLAERGELHRRLGRPVLVQRDKPSNAGPGAYQGVLFAGPVFLDLNVHPASTARPGIDTRVLFDRLPLPPYDPGPLDHAERLRQIRESTLFFWAMTPIALKYVGRGQTERAVTQLYLLLGAFVTTWRLVHCPERREAGGAYWLHPVHDADLRERVPHLGECIDPASAFDAITRLMAGMRQVHPAMEALGVAIPTEAVVEIERFREEVETPLATSTCAAMERQATDD
jgi:predicted nucleotidyltransferase